MRPWVYDCEVYAYDWIVVFENTDTQEFTVIHNDNEAFREFLNQTDLYAGFNTKYYDRFILQAINADFDNHQIKAVNDLIIGGTNGWQIAELREHPIYFNNVDLMDDVRVGISLKSIEGHLGMNIEETEVDFDIDRPLTPEELELVIKYCKADVAATYELMKIRKNYLQTKINLGKRAGIPVEQALSMTNAKLTAAMLHARKREWTDGRDYVYPPNLAVDEIPTEILQFFDTIHDKSIPDKELFSRKLEITIGGMPCVYAWGGVHGSLTQHYEEADENRVIQNRDVSSLYPSLIEGYHYLSRNVPNPELFYQIRRDRIQAKHDGNKQLAKDLKLPLNTVSGAQENRFNDLYDPLPTRSLRISGELFLTMLTVRLLRACKTIKLINLNTDGLMYSINKTELPIADKIAHEWEEQTGFELEVDDIQRVWLKDVNNLLAIMTDGEVKCVGGYLNYGIQVKGAWSINNNATVVKDATIDYFVHGTLPEETIMNCDEIQKFMMIAKAGHQYNRVYQLVDDKEVTVQNCNRVYATSDERYGTLYKIKAETGGVAKIGEIPEHCLVDNDNHLTVDAIDKNWYIQLAYKRIQDFIGDERRMATTNPKTADLTIYEKLAKAREQFADAGIKKKGKNMMLTSRYFKLDDIINLAQPILHENGLILNMNFTATEAIAMVVNMRNPEETITFVQAIREYLGNAGVTPVQAWGATVTYMRRYLYMTVLDIAEADQMEEGTLGSRKTPADDQIVEVKTEPKKPATPAERAEIKNELTNADGAANETQVKQLKSALKSLVAAKPAETDWVNGIIIQTESFEKITATEAEKYLTEVSDKLNAGEQK